MRRIIFFIVLTVACFTFINYKYKKIHVAAKLSLRKSISKHAPQYRETAFFVCLTTALLARSLQFPAGSPFHVQQVLL